MLLSHLASGRLTIACKAVVDSAALFVRDVGQGLWVVGHNALALVGVVTVAALALSLGHADVRQSLEVSAHRWLQERSESRALASGDTLQGQAEPHAVGRATAADIKQLPVQQARLAQWISRRYRVAPEPVSALVREAWETGTRARVDPALILAIMAIESRFNPFAQSHVGAQGLMQVMTRVHDDKYESFGGTYAAFDPVSNLRVGVQVLKESIARGGSVEEGLRHYVGAALLNDDGGYVSKVMSEQTHMRAVLGGRQVPLNASNPSTPLVRTPPTPTAPEPAQDQTAPLQSSPQEDTQAVAAPSRPEQLALMR